MEWLTGVLEPRLWWSWDQGTRLCVSEASSLSVPPTEGFLEHGARSSKTGVVLGETRTPGHPTSGPRLFYTLSD